MSLRPRPKVVYKLVFLLLILVLIIIILNSNQDGNEYFITVFKEEDDTTLAAEFHENKISNFTGFRYRIKNDLCSKHNHSLLGVIIITSYVAHDDLRSAHRQAISQTELSEMNFVRVFLLAEIPSKEKKFVTQTQIEDEHRKYGDLLQGNFLEAYRNLTYKHIMGLKWAGTECSHAKYIIKIDDDIVFDIYHLKSYLTSAKTDGKFLAGFILDNQIPIRLSANKWFVTKEEFAGDAYPDYLSGWLYITNPRTALQLVQQSQRTQFFWIDDTLVTGILRDKLNIPLIRLNDWYSSNSQFIDCCVRDLRDSSFECEYFVGPNGGDSKLIINFIREIRRCYVQKTCVKRSPEKSLKQTCVSEVKSFLQDHGNAMVRAVGLG